MKERIIILRFDGGDDYASTNAPKELIKDAINYVSKLRIEDEDDALFYSDFEMIQSYLNERGYSFEWAKDLEVFYW